MEHYLPPINDPNVKCLCCGEQTPHLRERDLITVGFGWAGLEKDGDVVWADDVSSLENCMTVAQAEGLAAKEPDRDWRIVLYGPLRGSVYQRQGEMKWLLVQTSEGFA